MTPDRDAHAIDTLPRLEALLGPLSDASVHKELPYVHPAYRAMIAASPFAVLATTGPGGLDASPRGDPAGFVQLLDDKTLLLPERRGNNRADSLRNIVAAPRVALLFLIPGVGETLRVNGHARITFGQVGLSRNGIDQFSFIHFEHLMGICRETARRGIVSASLPFPVGLAIHAPDGIGMSLQPRGVDVFPAGITASQRPDLAHDHQRPIPGQGAFQNLVGLISVVHIDTSEPYPQPTPITHRPAQKHA